MYEVGDVLYIVSNKRKNVIPVRVVEQILRKSLDGENISYKVEIPGKKDAPVSLHGIDGVPYESLEAARHVLYDQASEAINGLLKAASAIAVKHFGAESIKSHKYREEDLTPYAENPPPSDAVPQKEEPTPLSAPAMLDFSSASSEGEVRVQMPDGSYANIQMPNIDQ